MCSASLQVYDDSNASGVDNDRMTDVLRLHSDTLSPDSHATAAVLLEASMPPTRVSMRCVPPSLVGFVGSPRVVDPETSPASTIHNTEGNILHFDGRMQSQPHNLIPRRSPSTRGTALRFADDKLSIPACDKHDVALAPNASAWQRQGRALYVPMWSALTPIQYRGSRHITGRHPAITIPRTQTHPLYLVFCRIDTPCRSTSALLRAAPGPPPTPTTSRPPGKHSGLFQTAPFLPSPCRCHM